MNVRMMVNPLPFPQMLNELSTLKLILGVGLFMIGLLVFSMWKERVFALKAEDRTKFLMFNVVGGSWLIAVFAVSGGIYFLCDSIFKFTS
jgi:hypothetical protein